MARLHDDNDMKRNIENVFGNPENPMSQDEYIKKFDQCCDNSKEPISKNKIKRIKDFIFNIENEKDASSFLNIFRNE